MRVSFLHGSAGRSGADRLLPLDARLLAEAGADVTVVLPFEGPLCPALREVGATVVVEPSLAVARRSNRLGELLPPVALPAAVEDADLVLLNTLALLPYVPALLLRRMRFSILCHEILGGRAARLARVILLLGRFPVIANSSASGRWLRSIGVDGDRISVVLPALGRPRRPAPVSCPDDGGRLVLAVLSRLQWNKGHHLLLDALGADAVGGHIRLVVAGGSFYGDDPVAISIEERLTGLGTAATFLGEVDDVAPVIAASHGLVVPSTHPESFSLIPLEGAALGRRTIGARLGGLVESTTMCGGLLFRGGDVDDLRRSLSFVVDRRDWFTSPPPWTPRLEAVASGALRRAFWRSTLRADQWAVA